MTHSVFFHGSDIIIVVVVIVVVSVVVVVVVVVVSVCVCPSVFHDHNHHSIPNTSFTTLQTGNPICSLSQHCNDNNTVTTTKKHHHTCYCACGIPDLHIYIHRISSPPPSCNRQHQKYNKFIALHAKHTFLNATLTTLKLQHFQHLIPQY